MRFASRAVMFLSFVLLLHACGDSPSSGHHGVAPENAPASAETPGGNVAPPDNAALQYWQAFALLPTLDQDQKRILEDWNTVPLDDAVRKLLASSRSTLMYAHRAAKLRRCDWGLDYRDGISLHLPHLARISVPQRLPLLEGRR